MSSEFASMPDFDLRSAVQRDAIDWRFSMKMQKVWKSMAGARSLLQPVDSVLPSSSNQRQSSHKRRQKVWQNLYASPHTLQKSSCGNTWRTFSNGAYEDLAWSQHKSDEGMSDGSPSKDKTARTLSFPKNASAKSLSKQKPVTNIDNGLLQEAQETIDRLQAGVDAAAALGLPQTPKGALVPSVQPKKPKMQKLSAVDKKDQPQAGANNETGSPMKHMPPVIEEIPVHRPQLPIPSSQIPASSSHPPGSASNAKKEVQTDKQETSEKPAQAKEEPTSLGSSEKSPQVQEVLPSSREKPAQSEVSEASTAATSKSHEPSSAEDSKPNSKESNAEEESASQGPNADHKPMPPPLSDVNEKKVESSLETSLEEAEDTETTQSQAQDDESEPRRSSKQKETFSLRQTSRAKTYAGFAEDKPDAEPDSPPPPIGRTVSNVSNEPKEKKDTRNLQRGSTRALQKQRTSMNQMDLKDQRNGKRASTMQPPRGSMLSPAPSNYEIQKAKHKQRMKEWIEGKEWLNPSQDALVTFSASEKAIMRRYYELRDTDGSGALNTEEFLMVLDDMGRTPKAGGEDDNHLKSLLASASADTGGELAFENFLNMIAAYYTAVYDRIFHEQDEDGSGEIAQDELSGLLKELRTAGFDIKEELIPDLIKQVDKDGSGELDFREFCELMRQYRILEFGQLQKSSGWTTNQMLHLQTQFENADLDQSGSLDIKEVVSLLEKNPRGPPLETPEAVDRFVQYFARMDKDRSASLDFEEFLRLLRVWTNDGDNFQKEKNETTNSSILGKRTRRTIAAAGEGEDVDDAKAAMMLRVEALEYDVEMGVLSSQWGIKVEEVHALRESFEFCDVDGSGKIDQDEMVPLLENIGCPPTTQIQKSIIAECLQRFDLVDELNLAGTLRLVTTYQKALARATVRSFNPSEDSDGPKTPGGTGKELIPDLASLIDEQDADGKRKNSVDENGNPLSPHSPKAEGRIPMKKLVLAFYEVGQIVSRAEVAELLREVGIEQDDTTIPGSVFEQILQIHRSNKLLEWRRSYGFTAKELERFRKCCMKYAGEDLPMRITLEAVLEALDDLGKAPTERENREALMKAMMRIDRKGTGFIQFEEFVLLLRHLESQKVRRRNQEENKAAKAAGLDAESVQQFREAFQQLDDTRSGSVSKKNIREFLKNTGSVLGVEKKKLLELIFKQIEEKIVGHQTNDINFAQFLWVLRGLDNNGELGI